MAEKYLYFTNYYKKILNPNCFYYHTIYKLKMPITVFEARKHGNQLYCNSIGYLHQNHIMFPTEPFE